MKTEEQIRQDIIKDVHEDIGGDDSGLVRAIRRRKEFDEKSRNSLKQAESYLKQEDSLTGRVKRIVSKQARKEYQQKRRKYQQEKNYLEHYEGKGCTDLEGYLSFLEAVKKAAESGEPLESVTQIMDGYESEGHASRTYYLRARFPKFLEEEIRRNYLDKPVEEIKIRHNLGDIDGYALTALSIECREYPEMASSELVNQLFEKMQELYKRACQICAERGYRPLGYVCSLGALTTDILAFNRLRDVARMKGINESELEALRKQLEGDVDLSKLEFD